MWFVGQVVQLSGTVIANHAWGYGNNRQYQKKHKG